MSLKTDSLVSYFPDVYAARDPQSVLYKFLSAYGYEFTQSDKKIVNLICSHWVRYASGEALDQLGAMFNAVRLRTRSGSPEPDKAYRQRLESTVPMFIGGGTVSAIEGAVRLAMGLPYNLDQLRIPPQDAGMREELDALVEVVEFSPRGDVVLGMTVTTVEIDARGNMASQMVISLNATTVIEAVPLIEWRFQPGAGRNLSVELQRASAATQEGSKSEEGVRSEEGSTSEEGFRSEEGFKSEEGFVVWQGQTIVLTAGQGDTLSAILEGDEVGAEFTNLDGSSPAIMPRAPNQPSSWRFRAQGGLFDVSVFGSDTEVRDCFDSPDFQIQFSRVVYQPLTFDVIVPYFFDLTVEEIKRRYDYKGEILLYEGIGHQKVQEVVNQTRAMGVRGTVQFTLDFAEDQTQQDHLIFQSPLLPREYQTQHDSLIQQARLYPADDQTQHDQFKLEGVLHFAEDQGQSDALVQQASLDLAEDQVQHDQFELEGALHFAENQEQRDQYLPQSPICPVDVQDQYDQLIPQSPLHFAEEQEQRDRFLPQSPIHPVDVQDQRDRLTAQSPLRFAEVQDQHDHLYQESRDDDTEPGNPTTAEDGP